MSENIEAIASRIEAVIQREVSARIGLAPEHVLLDIGQVSGRLGVAQGTLSNMLSVGKFPAHHIKVGTGHQSRRWTQKQVNDWIDEQAFKAGRPRNAA